MIDLLPLLGVVLFVGTGFVWRSWLQRRRFGGSGIMLFRSGRRLQDLRELGLVLLIVVLTAQAIAALALRAAVAGWCAVPLGTTPRLLGMALMLGATALMVTAQIDMGPSWRVGFDERARPGLVVRGLYGICRNPIYVALLIALVGYTLMLPTWISFALLAGTVFVLRNQVREEEAYLLRTYGDAYAAYAERVGRFLPGVGMLHLTRRG